MTTIFGIAGVLVFFMLMDLASNGEWDRADTPEDRKRNDWIDNQIKKDRDEVRYPEEPKKELTLEEKMDNFYIKRDSN